MKIAKNILIGICSLLFYYLVTHLMFLWEYNESYAIIQNGMLFVLPALPGVALAIFFIRNSLKEFLKSWGVCILSSVCLFFIWNSLRIDLLIYTSLTGFVDFLLQGFWNFVVVVITLVIAYILFCRC